MTALATLPEALVDMDAHSWVGHWISHGPVEGQPDPITVGGEDLGGLFGRYLFATDVELAVAPGQALIRLTADSRYVLFVNGTEVGRGPVRSQPRRLQYDVHDLGPYLRTGSNTILALVTYYGHANSFWFPAAANPVLGRRPVLVLEGQVGEHFVHTDGSWRSAAMPAWSLAAGKAHDGVPVEVVDARALPVGWRTGEGVAWERANVVHASHLGALARSQPPTDPYGPLTRRIIGPLGGDVVEVADLVWTAPEADPVGEHPVARVRSVQGAPAPEVGRGVPYRGNGEVLHGVVDLGRVVCGLVRLELDAPAGTRVDLQYRERPWVHGVPDPVSLPGTGATYVARGHHDTFDAVEVNGFRYVHVLVQGPAGAPVRVGSLSVRELLYPSQGGASFRSSDPELDRLWAAGQRTVALNSHDAFIDCPTREQRAWVGDGVVHQMVHLATSTDWRLARQFLVLGASPREDGLLPMSVAGEMESGRGVTIPDWSLSWIHGVHEMFRHEADAALVGELLPVVERILRWYARHATADGVLADVPEWNLVDWSSIFLTGRSAILTALWVRGLAELADLAEHVGNRGTARWASGLVERARDGFEQFWDADRGTYVDHVLGGMRQAPASQLAGATAIVSGLAPRERWASIVDWITEPRRRVVRSWIGEDGGYSDEKIFEQLRGIQRIDWDAATECVVAEPFGSYLVHDALAMAGRVDLLVANLTRWRDFLTDGYDTFGECWGWGTPAHGWSSTPTRDLARYVLGVGPAAPGFATARVAPAFGVVDSFSGSVPCRHGLIEVRVVGSHVEVVSPIPVLLVDADGGAHDLPAGTHRL